MTIYNKTQVQAALARGIVAMLLISQNIQSKFYFLNQPQYSIYKNLQYDIYNLYSTITNELPYQTFSSTPDQYELSYYGLVGVLIEKTKTVDVFGAYDGAANPYYQAPGTTINIVSNPPPPIPSIPFSLFDAGSQLPDNGRVNYYNPLWRGWNPVLSLISPAETALTLGVDYVLVPNGGISLLPTGNLPEVYDGMFLRATSYVTA